MQVPKGSITVSRETAAAASLGDDALNTEQKEATVETCIYNKKMLKKLLDEK